jgi:hypothetical protein
VAAWTTFRSELSDAAVIDEVGQRLEAQGWTRAPVKWDRNAWQLQPLAEWITGVPRDTTAHAVVYRYPEGFGPATGSWVLNANAKPSGFALPGC